MTQILLLLYTLLLVYISVYAVLFILLSLFFSTRKSPSYKFSKVTNVPPVSVLIPSYNEGEGVIDAVLAVVHQDYKGRVDVCILLDSSSNNSRELESLSKFYDFSLKPTSNSYFAYSDKSRQVRIILTGHQHKRDKINFTLPSIQEEYIAVLDADHRPLVNWLSSSVNILLHSQDSNLVAVQSRRKPLSIERIPQIIDSNQAHFGNELFNTFLHNYGQSVFFTGTAALFKADILKKYTFPNSITEDTHLSYQLLSAGYRIAYNPLTCSYEEMAFTFRDYVLRRRRWAAGHTQSFISNFTQILNSRVGYFKKISLLLHGQFYLLPVAILLLLSIYGYYFFFQIGDKLQISVVLASLVLSYIFYQSLLKKSGYFHVEWFIAFLLFLPQVSSLSVYVYKFMDDERYHYILSFPYSEYFMWWGALVILAPLCVSASSYIYFRDLRTVRNVMVPITYIFTIILDLYAGLLGFFDFVIGRREWFKISRQNNYSEKLVDQKLVQNLKVGRVTREFSIKPILFIVILLASLLIINDLLAVNNCGKLQKFIWSPLVMPNSNTILSVSTDKALSPDGRVEITLKGAVSSSSENLLLKYSVDTLIGEISLDQIGDTKNFEVEIGSFELGWQKKVVHLTLMSVSRGHEVVCVREVPFSTVFQEFKGGNLYINTQKFLIKGMVPSFIHNKVDLSMEDGFAQFAELGVNTIRIYHDASKEVLIQAEQNGLLVINQPDNSTWGEMDVNKESQVRSFIRRYSKMVDQHMGEPYVLFNGLGNEWELCGKDHFASCINKVNSVLQEATLSVPNYPSHYATYATFINYPVDVVAINMLDTGTTYWGAGIESIMALNKPFYASEFGGFAAFYENTIPELRMIRMREQWNRLLDAGALGAVFFQSHDNWAQPVPIGYNDPFAQDHPDDYRGFWTRDNAPKRELEELRRLLSDVHVRTRSSVIDSSTEEKISLVIQNVREYDLVGVTLVFQGVEYSLGDLLKGEEKEVEVMVNNKYLVSNLIQFHYTTHRGLKGASQFLLTIPSESKNPIILNSDFVATELKNDYLTGRLLLSDTIDMVVPEAWNKFCINDKCYNKSTERMTIKVDNPYHEIDDIYMSSDEGVSWSSMGSTKQIKNGHYLIRFTWPEVNSSAQYLALSGLGANNVRIYHRGRVQDIPVHNYREVLISTQDLEGVSSGDIVTLSIYRDNTLYVDKAVVDRLGIPNKLLSSLEISFESPRVFAPIDITVSKLE